MSLHLVKLCVGVETPQRLFQLQSHEQPPYCTTRNTPRRQQDLLNGGSLYWVFRGAIRARQRIKEFRSVTRPDGMRYCRIMLDPQLILTRAKPMRAFQGWRYMEACPADIRPAGGAAGETDKAWDKEKMEEELRELGLL